MKSRTTDTSLCPHFEDWDGLLNEVWGVLEEMMPSNEFEKLREEQRAWVQEKGARYEKWKDDIDAKDVLNQYDKRKKVRFN